MKYRTEVIREDKKIFDGINMAELARRLPYSYSYLFQLKHYNKYGKLCPEETYKHIKKAVKSMKRKKR